MLWRRKLADAMAQVKNVCGACAVGVGMVFAKTVQDSNHFFLNLSRRGKQDIGIDVALNGFAGAIHGAAHHLAGAAQVHGPVQA